MTVREKMTKRLEDNGLLPDPARAIMKLAVTKTSLEFMKTRWNDECEKYPLSLFTTIWESIKLVAVEYIDINQPEHLSGSIFTNEERLHDHNDIERESLGDRSETIRLMLVA